MSRLPPNLDGLDGLRAWLEPRGWNVVPCHGTVHLLLPQESIRAWRRSRAAGIAASVADKIGKPDDVEGNDHG